MRPIRLELEGFTAFRESTVIDFDDVDLVAFVGPTGSGKSSLIDAITFALYGSVARYGAEKYFEPVINELGNEARVRLDFMLGGSHYVAVRIAKRTKTSAQTREARLERIDPDGHTEVVAGTVSELNDVVPELLGLDFGQFTRTVVLPQGEFARFLTDTPADRQRLLRQLLDLGIYERLGSDARRLAAKKSTEVSTLEGLLADRGDDADERAWLVDRGEGLRAEVDRATELGEQVESLEAEVATRKERWRELNGLTTALESLAMPDGLLEASERRSVAERDRAAANESVAEIDRRLAEIDETIAGADEGVLRQRIEVASRIDLLQVAVDDDAAVMSDLVARLDDTGAELDAAEAALRDAEAAMLAAHRHAGAAAVAEGLSPGDDCPVCGQSIGLVVASGDGGLAAAESGRSDADRRVKSARMQRNEVEREHAARASAASERSARLATVKAELSTGPTVEDAEAALARVTEARAARLGVVKERAEATRASEAAAAVISRVERELSGARHALTEARDPLVALEPPTPVDDIAVAWQTLLDWTAERLPEVRTERDEGVEAGKAASAEAAARREELVALATRFELEPGDAGVAAAMRAEIARVEQRLVALDDIRAETERLRTQRDDAERERQVQSQLGHHLSARGFERWLLTEAVDDLTARATERLRELSNQQYSLAADGTSFQVIDHGNADARRDVRTLSGGETFLASLALALALADSVAELASVDAPRLDSMFLDEGFGTLDPETLDVVATAIEELASTGRLVGVVTHVRDLAERLPTRFEVVKRSTGSVVTKVVT